MLCEIKFGVFKLMGLKDFVVIVIFFKFDLVFNFKDIKYDGVMLFVVELG